MPARNRMQDFSRHMWSWFERHKRTLPWRDLAETDDTQRAYLVLISEIMLQQTQVPRVIGAFWRFAERFPTVKDLAAASNKDVILAWQGMGYNSRALRLRDAAKAVMDAHGGVFPKDYDALIAINGIGPYTAGAIRNFVFNLPTPCIDTNIRRILHRVFLGPEERNEEGKPVWMVSDRKMLPLAGDTLRIALDTSSPDSSSSSSSSASSSHWHAALMDFGSLVCTSVPKCEICPMNDGTCKSAFRVKPRVKAARVSKEPGRMIAGRFVPNRIIRGRIVEALREYPDGLDEQKIGSIVCMDWEPAEHLPWLQSLLAALTRDRMIVRQGDVWMLAE